MGNYEEFISSITALGMPKVDMLDMSKGHCFYVQSYIGISMSVVARNQEDTLPAEASATDTDHQF